MSRETTFKLQVIVRTRDGKYFVSAEGSGFTGEGEAYSLSSAFDAAYKDLTEKLLEGTTG